MNIKELIVAKNEYLTLKGNTLDFEKFNQYAIVHHSTSIEGSTLSLDETFLLLDEQLTPKNKPLLHTLMTIDHYQALQYVVELAQNKTKLTLSILQKISSLLLKHTGSEISSMAGTFDSSKGDFRKTTVRAGNRTFPDYKKVPNMMVKLVNESNIRIEKADEYIENSKLAFDIHFQMVSIHPFADGNGRISRLLMNYVQAYHDFPMTIIFQEDKSEYYMALEKTRKDENIEVFRTFMFAQAYKYLKFEIENFRSKAKERKIDDSGFSFLF